MAWRYWIRTMEVEPSIYAADFSRLGGQIETLLGAGVRVFHFDVGDGHFVEPVTMGPIVLEAIAPLVHAMGGAVDCHLMVDNPTRHFPQIARAGGGSATLHFERTDRAPRTIPAPRPARPGAHPARVPPARARLREPRRVPDGQRLRLRLR